MRTPGSHYAEMDSHKFKTSSVSLVASTRSLSNVSGAVCPLFVLVKLHTLVLIVSRLGHGTSMARWARRTTSCPSPTAFGISVRLASLLLVFLPSRNVYRDVRHGTIVAYKCFLVPQYRYVEVLELRVFGQVCCRPAQFRLARS